MCESTSDTKRANTVCHAACRRALQNTHILETARVNAVTELGIFLRSKCGKYSSCAQHLVHGRYEWHANLPISPGIGDHLLEHKCRQRFWVHLRIAARILRRGDGCGTLKWWIPPIHLSLNQDDMYIMLMSTTYPTLLSWQVVPNLRACWYDDDMCIYTCTHFQIRRHHSFAQICIRVTTVMRLHCKQATIGV